MNKAEALKLLCQHALLRYRHMEDWCGQRTKTKDSSSQGNPLERTTHSFGSDAGDYLYTQCTMRRASGLGQFMFIN